MRDIYGTCAGHPTFCWSFPTILNTDILFSPNLLNEKGLVSLGTAKWCFIKTTETPPGTLVSYCICIFIENPPVQTATWKVVPGTSPFWPYVIAFCFRPGRRPQSGMLPVLRFRGTRLRWWIWPGQPRFLSLALMGILLLWIFHPTFVFVSAWPIIATLPFPLTGISSWVGL